MKAPANTTREQSNQKNIHDVGWRPAHGENGGVGKKNLLKYVLGLDGRKEDVKVSSGLLKEKKLESHNKQ